MDLEALQLSAQLTATLANAARCESIVDIDGLEHRFEMLFDRINEISDRKSKLRREVGWHMAGRNTDWMVDGYDAQLKALAQATGELTGRLSTVDAADIGPLLAINEIASLFRDLKESVQAVEAEACRI